MPTKVVNYLGDYCIISPTEAEGCHHKATVIAILRRIGFVSFRKLCSPDTTVWFFGIDIDIAALEMRLYKDKLAKLMLTLYSIKGHRKTTRQELERLSRILAHCSKVVKGARLSAARSMMQSTS